MFINIVNFFLILFSEKSQEILAEKAKKSHCPFCKEHKKRPLINYLRKRESRKHHESICEDEEN